MKRVHVFPVPAGMSSREAWDELDTMGRFVEYRWWRPRFHWPFVRWAFIEIDETDG